MAGLCYCELVTRPSSGSSSDRVSLGVAAESGPYRACYRLLGEAPAYLVAVALLMTFTAVVAACAVALSGTMNFLTGDRLNDALQRVWGGRLVGGDPHLDPVAAGAIVLTSFLLALGLEQAWFLRLVMNASSLAALLLFVAVGGANVAPVEQRPRVHEPSLTEVISTAALFSVLFLGVFDIARLSKTRPTNRPPPSLRARRPLRRVVPLAAAILVAGVVVGSFPLLLVLTLLTGSGEETASVIPLLDAINLSHLSWVIVVLGSLQVLVLGLSLVESLDAVSRLIAELAEDSLLPRFLAHECRGSGSTRTGAALLSGVMAGAAALCLSLRTLLQAGSCGILLVDVAVALATMYRRHRCAHAPLCPTTPSRLPQGHASVTATFAAPITTNVPTLRQGLRSLTSVIVRDDSTLDDSDGTPLLEIGGGPFDSPRRDPPNRNSTANGVESACSGYGSDSENSDVDAAVSWYKERVQVIGRGDGAVVLNTPPTTRTALQALVVVACVTACLVVLVGVFLLQPLSTTTIAVISTLFLVTLLLLVLLCRLPVLAAPQGIAFTLPGAPWVPAAVLLLMLMLLIQTIPAVAWLVGPYFAVSVAWYATFGWWSSNLRKATTIVDSFSAHAPPTVTGSVDSATNRRGANIDTNGGYVPDAAVTRTGAVGTDSDTAVTSSTTTGVSAAHATREVTIGMAKLSLPARLLHDSPTHDPLSSNSNLSAT